MPIKISAGARSLDALVERQMSNWELTRSQWADEVPVANDTHVQDFVCVSRMVGLEDRAIIDALGERLAWPVFDKELLGVMAGRDSVRRRVYDSMDQRDLAWWEEAVRSLVSGDFNRNDYFRRLCESVLSLARQASSVFVGRGADLLLPSDLGFRVRLGASLASRVERLASARGIEPSAAEALIPQIERERAEFFRRHFGVDPADPNRWALTVNVDRFSTEQTVEIILQARELSLRGVA